MMTYEQVFDMVKELQVEKRKTQRVPHYYKRHGQMVERSYPDLVYTDRYTELITLISEQKIFRCSECGEMCSYFDLETWVCDFEDMENGLICGCCYEDEMGDDL